MIQTFISKFVKFAIFIIPVFLICECFKFFFTYSLIFIWIKTITFFILLNINTNLIKDTKYYMLSLCVVNIRVLNKKNLRTKKTFWEKLN